MDKYVFDTNSLIVIFTHFYPSRFPSFWEKFNRSVTAGVIISVREVANEIKKYQGETPLRQWVKDNSRIFQQPMLAETSFVGDIFKIQHFQDLITKKSRLQGTPVADPWIIAKARIIGGYAVTEEKYKDNAAKIPNICKHFSVPFLHLEDFMEKENWEF